MPKMASISKWLFGTTTSWSTNIKRSNKRLNKRKEVNYENILAAIVGKENGIK
jgi:hypothetical protein